VIPCRGAFGGDSETDLPGNQNNIHHSSMVDLIWTLYMGMEIDAVPEFCQTGVYIFLSAIHIRIHMFRCIHPSWLDDIGEVECSSKFENQI